MKCEPHAYAIHDLARDKTTTWEGVRNYQARNFMRDDMQVGDPVIFYHSNSKPPAAVGLATVSQTAEPDYFAWDDTHKYYDPRSTRDNPIWVMVRIAYVATFTRPVSIHQMRQTPDLAGLLLLRPGSRLSITPITASEYQCLCDLGL